MRDHYITVQQGSHRQLSECHQNIQRNAHTGVRYPDSGHSLDQCKEVHNTKQLLEHKPAEKRKYFNEYHARMWSVFLDA
jgi:hypothetical protein